MGAENVIGYTVSSKWAFIEPTCVHNCCCAQIWEIYVADVTLFLQRLIREVT